MSETAADELRKLRDRVVDQNADLKALSEAWKEIAAQPMPANIKDALARGWEMASNPAFALPMDYPEDQRKEDRKRLIQVKYVREALVRQLDAAANGRVKSWNETMGQFLLEMVKSIGNLVVETVEDALGIVIMLTKLAKLTSVLQDAVVRYAKATLKFASVTNILKESEKMVATANLSIALCRGM
jgi:hypothetical protein